MDVKNTPTKRIDPDFEVIIKECFKELQIKFPDYENSWLNVTDKNEWYQRIANEVLEFNMSMSTVSDKRKLINIINLASMAWMKLK